MTQHDYQRALDDLIDATREADRLGSKDFSINHITLDRRHVELIKSALELAVKCQWKDTKNKLPKKPGIKPYEYVECLIIHKGEIKIRPWNCEHLVFDDEDQDDYFCSAEDADYWLPLDALPTQPQEK